MPIPEGFARLAVCTCSRHQVLPDVFRMVELLEEDGFPEDLVGRADEVAGAAAGLSEAGEFLGVKICQD